MAVLETVAKNRDQEAHALPERGLDDGCLAHAQRRTTFLMWRTTARLAADQISTLVMQLHPCRLHQMIGIRLGALLVVLGLDSKSKRFPFNSRTTLRPRKSAPASGRTETADEAVQNIHRLLMTLSSKCSSSSSSISFARSLSFFFSSGACRFEVRPTCYVWLWQYAHGLPNSPHGRNKP